MVYRRLLADIGHSRFLLVSLVMDAVLDDATIHQRRRTLHKMTGGFGLEDAYSTTLDRIRGQRGNRVKLAMEALMWISCSERPLKADELCHALAVEVGTTDLNANNAPSTRTILSCTLGLVTIDEQSSTVRLVHFTLQEYIASHNLFVTPHSMMAEICLTYLNFQSSCDLSTSFDTIPSATPFLHYATCCWGFHAKKHLTESVKQLALRLLRRDARHISAGILLREESVNFLSRWDRYHSIHPDLRGFTGLHCIAYMGITEIAITMVNMRVWDLNGRDANGATPLIWALKYGNSTLAKLLLEQGDVDSTLPDGEGLTPFAHAAKAGHQDVVELLLQRGNVNSDSSDGYGRTPLSYAAGSGHEGIVKILLERGDVNSDSSDNVFGWTPVLYAARSGHEGIVKILLERGDVNSDSLDKYGQTPLSFAATFGHEGVVKILLKRGDVNSDSSDEYGRTPLSYAAQSGHEGIVKILLERGDVNSDSSDKDGRTPLSHATRYGYEGVVKILLERGDVNSDSSGKDGRTPLSYAAKFGHESIVKILLERGDVNSDLADIYGLTPLTYAAESGHEGIVKILLERGDVDPDSSSNDRLTPLRYAKLARKFGVVKLLSEPRPSSHKPSQTSDLILKVSSPSTSPHEEEEPSPVSQHQRILPDIRDDIKKATPPPPSDQFPLNQLLASHQAHAPAPIPALRSTPASAISKNSSPSKANRQILRNAKRKPFPPS